MPIQRNLQMSLISSFDVLCDAEASGGSCWSRGVSMDVFPYSLLLLFLLRLFVCPSGSTIAALFLARSSELRSPQSDFESRRPVFTYRETETRQLPCAAT
jgi:hypothetical protein